MGFGRVGALAAPADDRIIQARLSILHVEPQRSEQISRPARATAWKTWSAFPPSCTPCCIDTFLRQRRRPRPAASKLPVNGLAGASLPIQTQARSPYFLA